MSKKTKIGLKGNYTLLIGDISTLLESARRTSARAVNSILTATYWEIGRRIVEYEYQGMDRSEYYGDKLLENLSIDLKKKFGRGFSRQNIQIMKQFYIAYSVEKICQTLSGKSSAYINISQTLSNKSFGESNIPETSSRILNKEFINNHFPLPWSHYVMLVRRIKDDDARKFYESEALRSGWSVRQLDRQISSQFYERTLLSKNKAAMLKKGSKPQPEDISTPEEEIKDPFILEFLGLKDEYSENDLEEALISHLEKFLLELGGDFCVYRQTKTSPNWK